ncbi:GNAT family N-acetyltransferase [candidate division KSB1 bacterium]
MPNNILDEGVVKKLKQGTYRFVDYKMVRLDESFLNDIVSLQELIMSSLKNKEMYRPASIELITKCLSEKGMSLGIMAEGRLIAFRMTYIPGESQENHGFDIGLSGEDLLKVVQFEGVCVNPEYRINRLASRLIKKSVDLIKTTGLIHVVATCFPGNYPMLKTFFENNFQICSLKIKYGWMLRYILYLNAERDVNYSSKKEVIVNHSDIEAQKKLLKTGFTGTSIQSINNDYGIVYIKQQQ